MIEILEKKKSGKQNMRWINIANAKKKELEYLKKNFNFNLRNLGESLGHIYAQRVKVDEHPGYLFVILRFPRFDKERNEIMTSEIDFFIGKNYLVTLHDGKLKEFNNLFNLCKKDEESLDFYLRDDSMTLLYEIAMKSMDECFNMLDTLQLDISITEEKIFSGLQKESINAILFLKHNIIKFRRVMHSHRSIFKKLIISHKKFIRPKHLQIYNNLVHQTMDIWDIAKNQKEMLEALEYTNDSKLSYKMNNIMKTLTILTVTVLPLSLLASIFGMNTMMGMPFIGMRHGFWVVTGIMMMAVIMIFTFFKRREWL